MVPAEVWFLAMSEGLVVGTTLTVTAGASTTTDYVAVALGGFTGGALALVGSGMTWWLKERADRRREIRTDQRALRDARAERLRAAYMTVLLSVRALLEVITRQTAPAMLIGEPAPDQLRALINEMGGAATKEIRAAEFALWLDGEDTELVHQATGAYAVYQLSLALPGVVAQVDANRQISLLNESVEALRMHARKRLEELGTPE